MRQKELIYERANLEYIVNSLLDENERGICIGQSYEERLKNDKKTLMEELNRAFSRTQQFLDIESLLNSTLTTFEDVYFEVGLKIGDAAKRALSSKLGGEQSEPAAQRHCATPNKRERGGISPPLVEHRMIAAGADCFATVPHSRRPRRSPTRVEDTPAGGFEGVSEGGARSLPSFCRAAERRCPTAA